MSILKILVKNSFGYGSKYATFSVSNVQSASQLECKILIVGGGTGGCSLAAKFCNALGKDKVIVVDPAENHYYQPMFTLVGGGMKRLEQTYRPMASVLPKDVKWIQEKVVIFDPKNNLVITKNGKQINYDMMLIAAGLQLNYDRIPGLVDALSIKNGKVCSIYSPKYVERTLDCLRNIEKGNAVFTFPNTPVKCPGAPQKIVYVAEHYFRKLGKRSDINVIYNTSLPVLFGVKHYADALWEVVRKRDIKVNLRRSLIEVRADNDTAIFANLDNSTERFIEKYSMLHVVPPMSTPNELSHCRALVNDAGFVEVDKETMQHVRFDNVFAIGDCASTPNSKTAASAAAQSPVVFHNMMAIINDEPLTHSYDGYASCPLLTGYHSCILAEFDYNLEPLETFPVAQNKERYSMFLLKKDLMPSLYWKVMLNGLWNGPAWARDTITKFNLRKK